MYTRIVQYICNYECVFFPFFFFSFSLICLVVSSPEDVVHRYKKLVRMYKRTRSIPETCRAFDLDRNTIAGTAVIADVLIAGEGGDFGELPIIAEKQSLASFAKVCKAFLDANPTLKEKVDKMRKANELLTIKYKFQK